MSPSAENLPRSGKRTTLGRLCGLAPREADRGERVLWLSGDGYRAALFHLGALTRLNELGLLGQIGTVGAVSGGSIAAAVLAARGGWPFEVGCPEWPERVAEPLRALAAGDPTGAGASRRRPFPGNAGEAALEERYARELLGSMGGEPSRGPRFVFGASGLALSGITGNWEECLEWDVGAAIGGYSAELVAAIAALPSGLEPFGEIERAVLENHGYLLAEAAAQAQGVPAGGGEIAAVAPPHPGWMDEERVAAALAGGERPPRIRRLHLRSRKSWERAG